MASSPAPVTGLTAAAAILAAAALALATPTGPWQPASVILGWMAVLAVATGVLAGIPTAVAVATALLLLRLGVHGLAGDRTPGLVLSAVLLLAIVELASASFEARMMPLLMRWVLLRLAVLAAFTVGVVGLTAPAAGSTSGPTQLVALVSAFLGAVSVVWVWRRMAASSADGVGQ